MQIRKVIARQLRHRSRGVDVAADVNAVVAANVGSGRSVTRVTSHTQSSAETKPERQRNERDAR